MADFLAFTCGLLGIVGFFAMQGVLRRGILGSCLTGLLGFLAAWGAVLYMARMPGGSRTLTAMLTGVVAGGVLSSVAEWRRP
jgi:hypothetical protein